MAAQGWSCLVPRPHSSPAPHHPLPLALNHTHAVTPFTASSPRPPLRRSGFHSEAKASTTAAAASASICASLSVFCCSSVAGRQIGGQEGGADGEDGRGTGGQARGRSCMMVTCVLRWPQAQLVCSHTVFCFLLNRLSLPLFPLYLSPPLDLGGLF